MLVDGDQLTPVRIYQRDDFNVPSEDLVQIYTPSNTFIANGIHASCKSEKDGSEYFLGPFTFLHKYVMTSLPQKISDFYHRINARFYVKSVLDFML